MLAWRFSSGLGLRNQVLTTGAQHVTSFVITDRGGRTLLTLSSRGEGQRQTYRLQRDRLQSVLIDALITTPVQYGCQALGYEAIDSHYRVIFTGGRRVDGDVVIAADMVSSALRRQLVDDSPHFLGLSAITGDAGLSIDDPLLSGGYFMTLVWQIADAAHPVSPFQGQGANTAMLDAVELAELLGSGNIEADADRLAARIATRGPKAVLASRRAARQFHTTSRFQIMNRNLGFR